MLTAFDLWLCVTIWIEWQKNACIFFYNWSWKWAVLKHSKIRCVDRLECCNFDSKTSLLVGTNCFLFPSKLSIKIATIEVEMTTLCEQKSLMVLSPVIVSIKTSLTAWLYRLPWHAFRNVQKIQLYRVSVQFLGLF